MFNFLDHGDETIADTDSTEIFIVRATCTEDLYCSFHDEKSYDEKSQVCVYSQQKKKKDNA